MVTIHIVFDKPLLEAADDEAKRSKISCSALIRDALRDHPMRLHVRELEFREQRGYARHPDSANDIADWERTAAWPSL